MTGHELSPLPVQEAHPPQPVPRAVHQPRDEPLHPVLPLRALLPRLCRRARPGRLRHPRRASISAAAKTACWRASSAAIWSKSARPASSPTKRFEALHPQMGPADGAVDLRALRRRLQYPSRRALRHAAPYPQPLQSRRSTATSCATVDAIGYEFVNSERRIRRADHRLDRY